jgi:hypothetical protein
MNNSMREIQTVQLYAISKSGSSESSTLRVGTDSPSQYGAQITMHVELKCIQKVFRPLESFHILLRYNLIYISIQTLPYETRN